MWINARRNEGREKMKKVVLLVSILTLITGCMQAVVNQRKAEISAKVNPLMGKSKDDVIMALGTPQKIERVGSFEVFIYYQSYGRRASAGVASNQYGRTTTSTGYAQSWEAYDLVKIYFKDGIAVKWDGYVQR